MKKADVEPCSSNEVMAEILKRRSQQASPVLGTRLAGQSSPWHAGGPMSTYTGEEFVAMDSARLEAVGITDQVEQANLAVQVLSPSHLSMC